MCRPGLISLEHPSLCISVQPVNSSLTRACLSSLNRYVVGDVRKLEEMLDKSSDPNQRDYYACNPLHGAAALGNQDAAELLIKAGAQPNMADRSAVCATCTAPAQRVEMLCNLIASVMAMCAHL